MVRPPAEPPRARRRVTAETDTVDLALADEPEAGPIRQCLVTRERAPKERMIRFVLGPDRTLVADLAERLPGRGMWLSARADVIEAACKRGAFARAARGPVAVPQDLAGALRAGLARRVQELLGLARRAGQAVAGFEKAREWVRSGHAALVLQASDGSVEERGRLMSGAGGLAAATPLGSAELGVVFGRDRVVHVAVARGKLAALLVAEAGRLSGLSAPAVTIDRSGTARQAGK